MKGAHGRVYIQRVHFDGRLCFLTLLAINPFPSLPFPSPPSPSSPLPPPPSLPGSSFPPFSPFTSLSHFYSSFNPSAFHPSVQIESMMDMYDSQPVSLADILTHDDPDPLHHLDMHNGDFDQDHGNGEEQLDLQTFFVRALYDYQSTDASSLSFRRGALIEVLTQLESGWWDGLLGEERGWFPSNYVELLSDEEAEAELNARDHAAAAAQNAANTSATTSSNNISHGQVGGNHGSPDWMDSRSQGLSSSARGVNGTSVSAEDFWVPQVTGSGQVSLLALMLSPQSLTLRIGFLRQHSNG